MLICGTCAGMWLLSRVIPRVCVCVRVCVYMHVCKRAQCGYSGGSAGCRAESGWGSVQMLVRIINDEQAVL